jgi:hypothetical protein
MRAMMKGTRLGYIRGRDAAAAVQFATSLPEPCRCHTMPELQEEIARRRTFAIISHPDAGKTTLTEKLLLFGGAIQLAGTVKGRSFPIRAAW